MLNEWVRNHKKIVVVIGVSVLLVLSFLIVVIFNQLNNPHPGEEQHTREIIEVSNIDVLYEHFSDYTIGYIVNAVQAAVNTDSSMHSGYNTSDNKNPKSDATNEELYPVTGEGDYVITIDKDSFDYYEDSWGMWDTFTLKTNTNQSFKVSVAIGAHNRDDDVGYTKINVTKL